LFHENKRRTLFLLEAANVTRSARLFVALEAADARLRSGPARRIVALALDPVEHDLMMRRQRPKRVDIGTNANGRQRYPKTP